MQCYVKYKFMKRKLRTSDFGLYLYIQLSLSDSLLSREIVNYDIAESGV